MTASPGWYPNPDGTATTRWWDGTEWSDRVTADPPLPEHLVVRLRAPEGTSPWTAWIGVLVAAHTLLALILVLAALFATETERVGTAAQFDQSFSTSTLAALIVGIAATLAITGIALLDRRALVRRGVPQPFDWAWSLLHPVIYLLGRWLVVRRRTGRGRALIVLSTVIAVVYAVFVVSSFVADLIAASAR
jgi:hypothetical protein